MTDAGGARPASDVDALIERRPKMVDDAYVMEWVDEAAAALVQLREENARLRETEESAGRIIASEMKMAMLQSDTLRRAEGRVVERNGQFWIDCGDKPEPPKAKVKCPKCGKRVSPIGLDQHHRDAHK